MPHTIGRTQYADFDRFIETFKTRGKAKRAEHGSRGSRVFRNADNPTEAIVVFDWDRDGVESFMADPEAREIMQAAGLQNPPDFTFVEHVADLEA